ncbi:hypothetical protein ccrud_07120 [Corynebacterium crudilactis]|uniref:Uncharacterized protein n=1 Tax=Corynebacterium crudilactis TaxID=1652495 RepID=A0A172QTG5_9CORY|nr:hypothetical protein ccrud_07120 [Corynebacterium crudilactis]
MSRAWGRKIDPGEVYAEGLARLKQSKSFRWYAGCEQKSHSSMSNIPHTKTIFHLCMELLPFEMEVMAPN